MCGEPNDRDETVLEPVSTTRQRASSGTSILLAARLIISRTGVIPNVPIISALEIIAPSQ